MNVEWAPIGDVLERSDEHVRVEPTETYEAVGLLNRGRGLFERPPLAGHETKYARLTRIHAGQLIFSKLFAWEGSVAVVPEEMDSRFVSSEFPTYDIDPGRALPTYVSHVVRAGAFTDALTRSTTGLGQRRQRVNPQKFEAIKIPLPSLPDQRRIAAHLDSVGDRADRVVEASSAQLPQFSSWIRHEAKRVHVRDLVTRASRPDEVNADQPYEFQGVRWYGEGLFTREVKDGDEVSARTVYRVEPGDLVYNRLFAWKQSFAIATQEGVVSNEFPTFVIDEAQVIPRVLLALLLTPETTQQVNDASTGSTPTSRNRLKEAAFMQLTVPLPDMPAQQQFKTALDSLDRAKALRARRDKLARSLLPAARNEAFSAMR